MSCKKYTPEKNVKISEIQIYAPSYFEKLYEDNRKNRDLHLWQNKGTLESACDCS